MTTRAFDSLEEMFADMRQSREQADDAVLPFQAAAKPGDCYVHLMFDDGLVIYGELLDPLDLADEDEKDYVRDLYAQPHMVNYRFGRHYSVCCEEGELGDIHVATIAAILTRPAFEAAKALGWPEGLAGHAWNVSRNAPDPIESFRRMINAALVATSQGRS